MIDLWYAPTPNGWKISIMLEECELPYRVIPLSLGAGDQFKPEFLAISPNNRMPAIVDHDVAGEPQSIFESGAILIYLAEKTGKFLSTEPKARWEALQWLFWQIGGFGPMAGQLSHFVNYAEGEHDYALNRYANEYDRLLTVMDGWLEGREFLAGDYSIADMAIWPWLLPYKRFEQPLDHLPNVRRWHDTMKVRPACRKGVEVGKEERTFGKPMTDEARKIMFEQGKKAGQAD
ncbi:MAG: thiol:disulfide oxidoreductase [Alphaproteobacteria bacterium]|jgi:GSH-dependent disulfide-bond oxidoreductase|nr:thiol:disulfide oxidoreductase [Alphaproteobacteria bacterium]MBT4964952.1 thiol:disulfide oxidoreductase [Alphaproteobacteria bacterium]MBT5161763.1 thiol:disulfide oxidoreductase [Alphaproteobacteria bacterium]